MVCCRFLPFLWHWWTWWAVGCHHTVNHNRWRSHCLELLPNFLGTTVCTKVSQMILSNLKRNILLYTHYTVCVKVSQTSEWDIIVKGSNDLGDNPIQTMVLFVEILELAEQIHLGLHLNLKWSIMISQEKWCQHSNSSCLQSQHRFWGIIRFIQLSQMNANLGHNRRI